MCWFDNTRRLLSAVFLSFLLSSYTMYELDCDKELLSESEKIALSQIGIRETGKNSGEVVKYLLPMGLKGGNPYCAAGVYWCFDQARIKLGYDKESIPIIKSAVANGMFNDAKARGKLVSRTVQKNDLLVWKSKRSWQGHIERVVSNNNNIIKTIGFNVKLEKGEGVGMKTRFLNHPLGKLMLRGVITFRELDYDN